MLRPTKHSHPDRTVISAAVILLQRLRKQRVEDFTSLRKLVKKSAGSDSLFLPAVNLLYLFGLIEYRPKTDALEYQGPP
jgi:hypothetical protein